MFIFNQSCLLCRQTANTVICGYCQSYFSTTTHRCLSCATPLSKSHQYCANCLLHSQPIKQSWVLYDYDKHLSYLIKKFKYQKQLAIGHFFNKKISQAYEKISQYHHHYDLIIPMPIHQERIKNRGFNQSIELTRKLAQQYPEKFISQAVIRQKNTPSFTQLNLKQRQQQVKKIFAINHSFESINTVLIIDDVMTTGCTINELAKTIYQQNPSIKVDALCVARATLTT